MNNIFSFRRFAHYGYMHYREHMRAYGIFLAVVSLVILYSLFADIIWGSLQRPSDLIGCLAIIYFAYFITAIIFVNKSFSSIEDNRMKIRELLIPVSTFERYIFCIFNAGVVALVLIGIIVFIGSNIASLYYYIDDSTVYVKYMFSQGGVMFNLEEGTATKLTEGFVFNTSLPHINPLSNDINYWNSPKDIFRSNSIFATILSNLSTISFAMWGAISFAKRGIFKAFLVHAILAGIVIWFVTMLILNGYIFTPEYLELQKGGISMASNSLTNITNDKWLILLSNISLILVYQIVVWRKLKGLVSAN